MRQLMYVQQLHSHLQAMAMVEGGLESAVGLGSFASAGSSSSGGGGECVSGMASGARARPGLQSMAVRPTRAARAGGGNDPHSSGLGTLAGTLLAVGGGGGASRGYGGGGRVFSPSGSGSGFGTGSAGSSSSAGLLSHGRTHSSDNSNPLSVDFSLSANNSSQQSGRESNRGCRPSGGGGSGEERSWGDKEVSLPAPSRPQSGNPADKRMRRVLGAEKVQELDGATLPSLPQPLEGPLPQVQASSGGGSGQEAHGGGSQGPLSNSSTQPSLVSPGNNERLSFFFFLGRDAALLLLLLWLEVVAITRDLWGVVSQCASALMAPLPVYLVGVWSHQCGTAAIKVAWEISSAAKPFPYRHFTSWILVV